MAGAFSAFAEANRLAEAAEEGDHSGSRRPQRSTALRAQEGSEDEQDNMQPYTPTYSRKSKGLVRRPALHILTWLLLCGLAWRNIQHISQPLGRHADCGVIVMSRVLRVANLASFQLRPKFHHYLQHSRGAETVYFLPARLQDFGLRVDFRWLAWPLLQGVVSPHHPKRQRSSLVNGLAGHTAQADQWSGGAREIDSGCISGMALLSSAAELDAGAHLSYSDEPPKDNAARQAPAIDQAQVCLVTLAPAF